MIGKKRLSQFFVAVLEENDKQDKSVFSNLSNYKKYYFKESTAPGMPSPVVTGTQQRATSQATQPKVQTKFTGGFGRGVGRGKGVPVRRTGIDAITGVGSDGSGGLDAIAGAYAAGKAAETGSDIVSALGEWGSKAVGSFGKGGNLLSRGIGAVGEKLVGSLGEVGQMALGEIGKGLGTQWLEKNIGNIANTMQQAYAQDAGSPIGMVVPGPTKYTGATDTSDEEEEKAIRRAQRAKARDELEASGYKVT